MAVSLEATHRPAARAESAPPVLRVRDLDVAFDTYRGTVQVLQGVSFEIARGEILGVVGESGAGKSMTGLAVMGLIEPPGRIAGGTVELQGERIDTLRGEDLRRVRGRRIAMVFQDPLTSLNPVYTIGRQLTDTIRTHLRVSNAEARERAIALLAEVEIPDPAIRFTQYPHQLSGGQRQRVAIALALCAEPELIIADEPTTALDVSVQAQVIRVFKRVCRERGMSAMLITHDMGVIAEAADRVAVMYQGQVVESGPVRAVLDHPQAAYTRALMAAIPPLAQRLHRLPVPGVGAEPAQPSTVRATPPAVPATATETAPLLAIKALSRDFDLSAPWLARVLAREPRRVLRAVDGVGFEIARGTTFGLVGESGSGKSTVARIIAGLTPPTAGQVVFDGLDRWAGGQSQASMQALRRRFQMIFQDPYASLNPRWRIDRIIAEPLEALGLTNGPDETEARVAEALAHVRMPLDALRRYPHQFSGGQRQRIAIARALVSRPDFIICDEPTSSLDVSVQAQVLNLMRDLQDEFGLTYLLISHNLAVIRYMCDDVGVMQRGRLVEQGTAEAVLAAPQHAYTRELMAAVPGLG
ncbi:MAG: Glutathione import ATP-binding protein GsiA [Paracidovorax wautersii]|uniref:Glutathione import ATP-binding protein GsiA n=1 Tax=Paracidovorax wautersii TaxID=1177982 RepID=A0A7V8FRG1_9BURK|nr:MAG: Glutathione import ATP-binding protein GsiA [Paracidovorax wautersii]